MDPGQRGARGVAELLLGARFPPSRAEKLLLASYLKWKYVELVLMSGAWAPRTLFPVK